MMPYRQICCVHPSGCIAARPIVAVAFPRCVNTLAPAPTELIPEWNDCYSRHVIAGANAPIR